MYPSRLLCPTGILSRHEDIMFTILKVKTEEIPETDKLSNEEDDQDERRLFRV